MKQNFLKKLTSLILVAMMVIALLPASLFAVSAAAEETYEEIALASIQATDTIIIVAKKSGSYYAMSNDKGTNSPPVPVSVSVTSGTPNTITTDATNIGWNIAKDGDNLTIYPDGQTATWLYCTNSNNGVRVGDGTAKTFVLDATTGYLKNTQTTDPRYLGVYNTQDWRCYKANADGSMGSNIAGQEFTFYKLIKIEVPEHTCADVSPVDCVCDQPNCGKEMHKWGNDNVVAPTCEDDGYTEQTCTNNNCSNPGVTNKINVVSMLGGSHSWSDIEGSEVAATCTDNAYKSQECTNENCPSTRDYEEYNTATGHNIDLTTGECQSAKCSFSVYIPVVGDVVYLTNENANKKLTSMGTIGSNNVGITDDNASPLALILEASGENIAFKCLDGKYISWTSGNTLTTSDEKNNNSSWKISVDTKTGKFTVTNVSTLSETESRTLQYNNSNPRFACYTSTQSAVKFEKVAPTAKEWSLTLNGTIGVNVYYNIDAAWLAANAGAQVVFQMDGYAAMAPIAVTAENAAKAFSYAVSPELMGKNITVKLMVGETVVLTDTVSVQAYIDYQQANATGALLDLVDAMEVYGAAAVDYVNKKAVDKVEGSVANIIGLGNSTSGNTVATVTMWSVTLTGSTALNFQLNLGNPSANHTLTVTLGGVEIVKDAKLADYMNGNTLTISNLSVLDFEKELVITIGDGAATTVIHAYAQRYVETRSKDTIENYEYNLLVALDAYRAAAKAYFASVAA